RCKRSGGGWAAEVGAAHFGCDVRKPVHHCRRAGQIPPSGRLSEDQSETWQGACPGRHNPSQRPEEYFRHHPHRRSADQEILPRFLSPVSVERRRWRDAPHGAAPGIAHDGVGCQPSESWRRTAMDQATRLKWAAVAFTIFWIGGMLWWSGEYDPAYVIILSACGTLG